LKNNSSYYVRPFRYDSAQSGTRSPPYASPTNRHVPLQSNIFNIVNNIKGRAQSKESIPQQEEFETKTSPTFPQEIGRVDLIPARDQPFSESKKTSPKNYELYQIHESQREYASRDQYNLDANEIPEQTIPSHPTEVSHQVKDHNLDLSSLGFSPVKKNIKDSPEEIAIFPTQEPTFRRNESNH